MRMKRVILQLLAVVASGLVAPVASFSTVPHCLQHDLHHHYASHVVTRQYMFNDNRDDEAVIEEEQRLKILKARRNQIRSTLKSAENLRNYRLKNDLVPELDQDGKPVKSDGKVALTFTAFVIAAGAVALRVGGRAALISAVGLDFMTDNPELKSNLDQVLTTAETMDPATKLFLFTAAWTAVKCLLFDAGGVVLALASGILFGGVWEGAVISAAAATFGSSVAFGLAKMDTPVRKKALELLEEYPSLRGIEKVVARDGLKAILTLRLAPVLPIPLGMYTYIYGVTNVGFLPFAGGIFLGSLKPYLLDSYLGYFGKTLVDGTSDAGGMQDVILLVALGASVLIGVFASQLASETWDSVLQEVEDEKKAKVADGVEEEESGDDVMKEVLGIKLPEWMVGFQYSMQDADERVRDIVAIEYHAKVWNFTEDEGGPPADIDPATFPQSPEIRDANQGIDIGASVCDGLVLSPILFEAFLKFADPLYKEEEDDDLRKRLVKTSGSPEAAARELLLARLESVRTRAAKRINFLEDRLKEEA